MLEKINSPQDIRTLTIDQLSSLCADIRKRMIEVVSANGGHLASSLGTVELILGLHYCLETPRDKILFDVGHQAYAHKIITGRNRSFGSLRQLDGISGFPCREESDFDTFTAGHSSSAVSIALGLASCRDSKGENFKVAAVIGDGSLSGGLCFEGLNNAGHLKKDILVVLNTNEMSIAPNVGALSTYLNKVISQPLYNRFKDSLENFLNTRVPKGKRIIKLAYKFEEGLKGLFIPGMFFEELGFRYFGPFDGNNLQTLVPSLKKIINIKGPKLVHVITKKGKGYAPAENDPVRFHSTGPFEIATGNPVAKGRGPGYTEVFSRKLVELAKTNNDIIAVTAAMPEGTGLDRFRDAFPERFFDVGIAEGHAVCFCAGLASGGKRPVVAIYSTFLQRAYDQIIEEVCLQKLPVVFVIDRAGISGEDGLTHQGLFDLNFLANIPNAVVMAPKDGRELEEMLEMALSCDKACFIRFPKDTAVEQKQHSSGKLLPGKCEVLSKGKDGLIIAIGSMVLPACEAAKILSREGLDLGVVNARFANPFDKETILALAPKTVFTVEEGITPGGFGSIVAAALKTRVVNIGLPVAFVSHGLRAQLLAQAGLNATGIAGRIKAELNK